MRSSCLFLPGPDRHDVTVAFDLDFQIGHVCPNVPTDDIRAIPFNGFLEPYLSICRFLARRRHM